MLTPYAESNNGYYTIIDVLDQYVLRYEIDSIDEPIVFIVGLN